MEIILKKDVAKVGKAGSVVKVKDGFARNFLFPSGLAEEASTASLKRLEKANTSKAAQAQKHKQEAEALKGRLESLSLTISALTQDGEKLYGSVGPQEISEALKEEGIEVARTSVDLREPLKSLGIYEVPVKVHPEVTANLKLWIVKK